jgi:hypothetical protein
VTRIETIVTPDIGTFLGCRTRACALRRLALTWVTLVGAMLIGPAGAVAHVEKQVGPFVLEIGWGVEPPYAGTQNFIDVTTSERSGAVIAKPGDGLSVEISYGATRTTRPLQPTGAPGKLSALLVPTRAGTYTFHVSGTLRGRSVDTTATCSSGTFECVNDPSELEFPAKDPSNGELAARLTRSDRRGDGGGDDGKGIAIAALVVAVLALLAAFGLGLRRGRRSAA